MEKARILVVEDESIVAKDIENSLKKLGYTIVGVTPTGEEAISLAKSKRPDVILMDIMLKGAMSGVEAAAEIKKELDLPVIYLTAYADEPTLEKAKHTEPHGYIIKPFKEVDLQTNIELALFKHAKEREIKTERALLYSAVEAKDDARDLVFVKSKSRMIKLRNKDIFYIEALKDYVTIYTADESYTILSTMKSIEEKLPKKEFIRVHRSYIVHIDKIAAIDHHTLILENSKKEIPIGGFFAEELERRLNML